MADSSERRPGLIRRAVQSAADLAKSVARNVAQLDFFARFKGDGDMPEIDFPIDVGHDTIWATEQQMADLFGVSKTIISERIKEIFDNNELPNNEKNHSRIIVNPAADTREITVSHYSLDVIFTIGYRVNGSRAAEFRQWANRVLRGYVEDGYALNGNRLQSDPAALQKLSQEVRAIRTSEKNLYQRVRETFVLCAVDYESSSKTAHSFFAYSQDAFHYAVSEHTAAQIILERADASKPNMGMISLGNKEPNLADAQIAKNYMTADELRSLELLGEAWLIYAEGITQRNIKVSMERLTSKINELIVVNEYKVFPGYGGVRSLRPAANEHAKSQLAIYRRAEIKKNDRSIS